jgi:hypothetical protein
VKISTDCGMTFDILRKVSANNMFTVDGNLSTPFVPTSLQDWVRDSISIDSYVGNDILIRFETINRQGNNVYIDNIGIYESEDPLLINQFALEQFRFYPNPTTEDFTMSIPESANGIQIEIVNILGKKVHSETLRTSKTTISTNQLKAGTYFIKIPGFKIEKLIIH